MKKSIVTFLAAAALVTVAAPVATTVFAENNTALHGPDAIRRMNDYAAAVAALAAQNSKVAMIQGSVDAKKAELADLQVIANAKYAFVEANKTLSVELQDAAAKAAGYADFAAAVADLTVANNNVATAQADLTNLELELETESAKLPALQAEVARTEAILTPAEKAAADKGEIPADDVADDADDADDANTAKPADKKAEGAKAVKPAATATGSKALPKTSAAK